MKKFKLKKVRKIKISTKISILILILIVCVYFLITYINKNVYPVLMNYAKADAKKMALLIMDNSVNEEILNALKEEDIFSVSKNKTGEVSDIDFNPVIVNKVLSITTSTVKKNLENLERGNIENITFINKDDYDIKNLKNGVISEIPVGLSLNNALLANIGPKIPVKINLVGNVVSYASTKIHNYGINNALVEVYAHVEVTEEVIIPLSTSKIKVRNDIPIAIKIVQGTVPDYYSNSNLGKNSNTLSLPIEID